VDGGRWTVNGGQWTVDNGRWMVHGKRLMEMEMEMKMIANNIDGKTLNLTELINN